MGECFFWYLPTRVVPDQRPLNGCCSTCITQNKTHEVPNLPHSQDAACNVQIRNFSDGCVIFMQVHDLLHFFPPCDNQLSFIWGSAKSGFMHLYHVTVSLEPSITETWTPDDTSFNNMSLHPSECFLVFCT